jgi:hypothetical protein
MACKNCENKGYIEYYHQSNSKLNTIIAQCKSCNDISAYSAEVQRRLKNPPLPETVSEPPKPQNVISISSAKIIPFRKK